MWSTFTKLQSAVLHGVVYLTMAYLIIPTLIILPISLSSERYLSFPPAGYSLQWYKSFIDNPGYAHSMLNTLKVGIPVTILSMALGTLAALSVVRGNLPMQRSFSALVLAPLMLPQIILAIGLFPVLASVNLLGGFVGIIIAHTVISIPLVMITVSAALRGFGPNYELAAMTMGANWWQTFWSVTFPMIRPAVLVGGLFAFAASFDEIIIALFLTDFNSVTLPKFMFSELQYQLDPTIAAASTVVVSISLILLTIVALIQRRSSSIVSKAQNRA
ncbi:ABC transporter permease [Mesorhizobium sp. CU2]|uniref:ABC transporter permease n=1 Tax=unclassified Mesorhizobium TaxID=325217 RepID=UPI001125DD13|nr:MULTISPECIES: ABC transporter permease [unclassified Mesorhizobium]TPN81141.1 ABC transporter permease [Mesorhizobium sp. CU3]TPO17060.1 ABC transporter permease [Mesorhizobium sp. CU2]